MPVVSMPNGDLVQFPDDMSRDDIGSFIKTKFPESFKEEKGLLSKAADGVASLFDSRSAIEKRDVSLDGNDNGFDKNAGGKVLDELKQQDTLKSGAKIVDGLSGVTEVGLRKGYAGLGRIEAGLLKAAGDFTGSETLKDTAADQNRYANEIENGAVLRGTKSKTFEPDALMQEAPQIASEAIGSVITSTPALASGYAIPTIFATSALSDYGQNSDKLNAGGAITHAVGSGLAEAVGEKLGGTDKVADALSKALGGKSNLINLGVQLLTSGAKEIPSEIFTTTAQFLIDKNEYIGLNKDATLDDYVEQIKHTAKVAAMQGAGMGGIGGVIKNIPSQFSSDKDKLKISQGSAADDLVAAKKQADYENEQANSSHLANINAQDTVDGAIKAATNAIDAPISIANPNIKAQADADSELLNQINAQFEAQTPTNNAQEVTQGALNPLADTNTSTENITSPTSLISNEPLVDNSVTPDVTPDVQDSTMFASREQDIQPITSTENVGSKITLEAQNLLQDVDKNGIPKEVTSKLRQIAMDNGIQVYSGMPANFVIDELRDKLNQKTKKKPSIKPQEDSDEVDNEDIIQEDNSGLSQIEQQVKNKLAQNKKLYDYAKTLGLSEADAELNEEGNAYYPKIKQEAIPAIVVKSESKNKPDRVISTLNVAQLPNGKWIADENQLLYPDVMNRGDRNNSPMFSDRTSAINNAIDRITQDPESRWNHYFEALRIKPTTPDGDNNAEQMQGQETAQEIAPVKAKTAKPKISTPKTLLATLRDVGGIAIRDKRDITGEDKKFASGGYNQVFKINAKFGLKSIIESGDVDQYLPHSMRLESNGINDDAFDSTEAYDYLADKIRNGERVLPYEVEQELKALKYEGDAVGDVSNELSEDEINEQLQQAGNEERESSTDARVFDTEGENSSIERSTGTETRTESQTGQDLLGDNTSAKQAIADAEKAKDAKRNTGTDNQDTFNLTGSNSEADKAAAAGAQDLFSQPVNEVAKAAKALTDAGITGTEKLKTIAEVRKGNLTANEVAEAHGVTGENIQDLGEKIGGARKDTSTSTSTSKPKRTNSNPEAPTWAKRYNINEIAASMNEDEKGTWIITDSRDKNRLGMPRQIGKDFATKEDAEAALPALVVGLKHRAYATAALEDGTKGYEIWRSVTERKRVKVVDKVFADRTEALTYMADNAKSILETNTTFGEADLPTPDDINRIGAVRRDGDVKSTDFETIFGFRGIEFGNWNNQIERQQVMNAAYDGLLDLAEVLNLPPKALALNGDLALAFGARGQGLSSAKAHYERDKSVINLTKMNGAGSLAHEWFHALDHYFGRQDGKASAEWVTDADGTRSLKANAVPENDMVSSGFSYKSKVRPELKSAYDALINTMIRKATTYVEDSTQADNFVGRAKEDLAKELDRFRNELSQQKDPKWYKRKNAPASAEQLIEFDTIAKQLLDGQNLETAFRVTNPDAPVKRFGMAKGRTTNDSLEKLSAIYKDVRGRAGFDATNNNGWLDNIRKSMSRYSGRLQLLAQAQQGEEKVKQVPTDFVLNAKELDQGRGSDYWTKMHELAARAFQGYVEDKIKDAGGKSPFMNYGRENSAIETPWGFKFPFPRGDERKAINAEFDKFVGEIKTKETDKGIALFNISSNGNNAGKSVIVDSVLAQKVVDRFVSKFSGASDIKVVDNFSALPKNVQDDAYAQGGNENNTKGALDHNSGTVYVVANNHNSESDVEETVLHEMLGHVGIRTLFGKSFVQEVNALFVKLGGIEGLAKIAKARGFDKDFGAYVKGVAKARGQNSKFTEMIAKAVLAEEVFSMTAQQNPKLFDKLKALVGMLRQNLRDLGLVKLAEYGETDLLWTLQKAKVRLQTGKADGKGGWTVFMTAYHGSTSLPINKNIQNWAQEIFNRRASKVDQYVSILKSPSETMNKAGIYRPIVMEWSHASHVFNNHPEITPNDIAALPELLKTPRAIMSTKEGWRLILDSKDRSGRPIFVVLNNNNITKELRVTEVSTLFGANDSARILTKDLLEGKVKYISEKSIARLTDLLYQDTNIEKPQELMSSHQLTLQDKKLSTDKLADASDIVSVLSDNGNVNIEIPKNYISLLDDIKFSKGNSNNVEFYSHLHKVVSNIPDKLFSDSKQIKAWLMANASKFQVKKDELEWSGIYDYLDMQGKVTKDDVLSYLDANGVQVKEVMLGDTSHDKKAARMKAAQAFKAEGWELDFDGFDEDGAFYTDPDGEEVEYDDLPDNLKKVIDDASKDEANALDGETKYEKYTVDGGTDYKELLLTLPQKEQPNPIIEWNERVAGEWNAEVDGRKFGILEEDNNSYYVYEQDGNLGRKVNSLDSAKQQVENQLKQIKKPRFQSSHFDQPNILAHVRFDTRTDADGKKVMFVSEVQSDWGQEGRKKGFTLNDKELMSLKGYSLAVKTEQLNKDWRNDRTSKEEQDLGWEEVKQEMLDKGITDADIKIASEAIDAQKLGAIPKAPFVTDTKGWASLAIKKIIAHAVDNGFAKVAFINGEQAADLYDLSKSISNVTVRRFDGGAYGFSIIAKDLNGKVVLNREEATLINLADYVGKELSEKIKDDFANKSGNEHSYSGLDLKVGGEGMRGFYDTLLPQVINDVLKRVGGGKVEPLNIAKNGREGKAIRAEDISRAKKEGSITEQIGFTITPELRNKVTTEGIPLFSKGNNKGNKFADALKTVKDSTSSKDKIAVAKLNSAVEKQDGIKGAFKAIEFDDSGLSIALQKISNRVSVHYVVPINQEASNIHGVQIGNDLYINPYNGQNGFIQLAGHELLHHIRGLSEEHYQALLVQAKTIGIETEAYKRRLESNGIRLSDSSTEEELLADFLGDALADPEFLQLLADDNPSTFKKILDAVIKWLDNVSLILSKEGFGSSEYIKDVNDLRGYLWDVLDQFSKDETINPVKQTDTPEFKAWFGDSKVVDADGKPRVYYHGTGEGIDEFRPNTFFTFDPKAASTYAKEASNGYLQDETGKAAYVLPVYIKALKIAEDEDVMSAAEATNVYDSEIEDSYRYTSPNFDDFSKRTAPLVIAELKRMGFDSIYHEDYDMDGNRMSSLQVFDSSQIKSSIGNNGNFDANNNDIRYRKGDAPEESIPEETNAQAIQRIGQDKFNRFKVLKDWLVQKGVDLSEAADVYLSETLMSGRIASRKEDFREDYVQPLIKKTQEAGITMEQVGDFLKAQHAPEANKRARELQGNPDATAYGVSDKDAKASMAAFKALSNFAELKSIANGWRSITDQTKQIKLESGLLTDEMVKAWEDTYDVYVPVKGNDEAGTTTGTGKGLHVNGKTKQRLGHGLRDEAIIENILRDHETAITLDEKNRVGKALIKFLLEAKNDEIGTIDKPVKRKVLKQGETAFMVNYHGSDIASFENYKDAQSYISKEVLKRGEKSGKQAGFEIVKTQDPVRVMLQASPMLADNEVHVYVGGHAVRIQINDEIAAREYRNMGVEHLNSILSAGREINNWLSKAYTGYSPDFIFTNPIRDAIQGAITLTGNHGAGMAAKIFKNYPHAIKELVKHFRHKGSSSLVTEYRMAGGSTGGAYLSDLERIGNDIQDSYNEYQGSLQTFKNTYDKAIADGRSEKAAYTLATMKAGVAGFKKIPAIGHFLSLMEHLNAVTENALRVATYQTLRDSGMSKNKAAAQAKDLMNFNRKGEKSNAAGALYLFFNPSVQGSKLIQEALFTSEHKHQAQALAGSMTLMAIAVGVMALSGDDDDKKKWENTPDYVKDGNIVINIGGKQITIPLPYGYRMFWTLGNVMLDAQQGKDLGKLGIRLASSVFANLSPIGNPMEGEHGLFQVMPTTAKMLMASGVNEDSFGRAIMPKRYKEATPDSQLMNRNTHGSFYDGVTEKLNSFTGGSKFEKGLVDVSPETLKFWVKSLTGGTGQFVADSANIAIAGVQGVAPQDVKDIPVVRRFARESDISDARSAFWERKNEADLAAEEISSARKSHDREALMDLRERKGVLASMASASDRMLKMANAKRDAVALIRASDLSLREQVDQINKLEQQEAEVYDRYVELFDTRTKHEN